nr:ATP-binding protein [uncultured Fusobacterium sp.]
MENAFVHGLEEKEGPGTVTIQGILNEDEHIMVFRIHDDGIGMTKAQTENILNIVPGKKGGFGISSVQKRIQLLYGKEYGINILSQPGKGTTVIIRIPAKE